MKYFLKDTQVPLEIGSSINFVHCSDGKKVRFITDSLTDEELQSLKGLGIVEEREDEESPSLSYKIMIQKLADCWEYDFSKVLDVLLHVSVEYRLRLLLKAAASISNEQYEDDVETYWYFDIERKKIAKIKKDEIRYEKHSCFKHLEDLKEALEVLKNLVEAVYE